MLLSKPTPAKTRHSPSRVADTAYLVYTAVSKIMPILWFCLSLEVYLKRLLFNILPKKNVSIQSFCQQKETAIFFTVIYKFIFRCKILRSKKEEQIKEISRLRDNSNLMDKGDELAQKFETAQENMQSLYERLV